MGMADGRGQPALALEPLPVVLVECPRGREDLASSGRSPRMPATKRSAATPDRQPGTLRRRVRRVICPCQSHRQRVVDSGAGRFGRALCDVAGGGRLDE